MDRFAKGDVVKVIVHDLIDKFGKVGIVATIDKKGYWIQFPGKDNLLFFQEYQLKHEAV